MRTMMETKRLLLKPFSIEDVALFHEINTTPFVRRFLWDDQVISRETAVEIMEQNQRHFQENAWGLWKIFRLKDEVCIGYTGLWYFFEESQPQLIYALLKPFTGQGYANEAAEMILQYAFSSLNFDYLLAATDEGHQSSQDLAKRLGMKLLEQKVIDNKSTFFYRIDRP